MTAFILQPGETLDITVTGLAGGGATVNVNAPDRPPPPAPMLMGMTASPDTATTKPTTQTVAAFPGIRYMRDFGRKRADGLTDISMPGTGKWLAKPADCVLHVSWKGPLEQLVPFLDAVTEPFYLTRRHEPHGDIAPDALRAENDYVTRTINSHPNGGLCLGHGPIVSRYWLMQKPGTDPADWAYDGMTHYGVDCYNDYIGTPTRYLSAEEMFAGLDRVGGQFPNVGLWVPEYGIALISGDGGTGRAAAMRSHVEFLKSRPNRPAGVAWWNIGGNFITGKEPEQTYWREVLRNP